MATDFSSAAPRKSTRVDPPHGLRPKGSAAAIVGAQGAAAAAAAAPAPRHDAPRHDAPRHDAPQHDAPRHDAPRCDAPRCDAPGDEATGRETALRDADLPSSALLEQIAGFHRPGDASEQLRRQADELSGALRAQQVDIDRREAAFHAQLARLENELRLTRLLQQERESQLEHREADFAQRQHVGEAVIGELPEKEKRMAARQMRVAGKQAIVARNRWRQRLSQLDASERLLKTQLADVGAERKQLDQERHQLDQKRKQQQQEVDSARRLSEEKLRRQQVALRRRATALDRRRDAMTQMHAEVTRMHREAVEMRLCTEELWGRLTEEFSPAELTQRLGALRSKLADQFQLAQQSLTQQRKELCELMRRLSTSQQTVSRQRTEVQAWVARRQSEIEEQAARLIAREHQLDTQQFENRRLQERLQQQRHEYEQEIRRLLRLVKDDAAA